MKKRNVLSACMLSVVMFTTSIAYAQSGTEYKTKIEKITRKASEEMAKSGEKYNSFELKTVKIIPNGNLITEIGTYTVNVSVPGMDQPVDDHGKYLTMYEKQKDGSLKIKIEIWNSDIDPMGRMKQMDQPGADTKK
jgi:ketosteroid isomerase-like protein